MQRWIVRMTCVAMAALLGGCAKDAETEQQAAATDPNAAYTDGAYTTAGAGYQQQPGGYYGGAASNDTYAGGTSAGYSTYSGGSTGSSAGYSGGQASAYTGGGGGQSYVVQRGDSLYKLARQFYGGDMSKWRTIYDANRDRLADPNQLPVGMTLVIP